MGVVGHRRSPRVDYRGDTDPNPEMFFVGGDGDGGLGTGFEQQVIDHPLVLIGDVGNWLWQREDQVEVVDWQEFGLAFGKPGSGSSTLAFGAVSIPAAVIGDHLMIAVLTTCDFPACSRIFGASLLQTGTWPPRAAVRQRSMALMTLSWPRLRWPALAARQAAPWSRKISATSRLGWRMEPSD